MKVHNVVAVIVVLLLSATQSLFSQEVFSVVMHGENIRVGDLADDVSNILTQQDLLSEDSVDDPANPGSKIMTKHYKVGEENFALVFTKTENPGPYRVKKILLGNGEKGAKKNTGSKGLKDKSTSKKEGESDDEKTKTEKPKMHEGKEIVVMETSMGTIEFTMFRADAPRTVDNFIGLAKKGYYNGLTFHRVIDNFMIQGGDPNGNGTGGESIYGKKFEDEISPKLKFDRPGLLAMANAGPGTNGSQFFVTLVPTPWLTTHHTIFGEVVSGMEVVRAMGKVPTSKPGDKPLTPVTMKKVFLKGGKHEDAESKDKK